MDDNCSDRFQEIIDMKMSALTLKPTDVIFITAPEKWTADQLEQFLFYFKAVLEKKGILNEILFTPLTIEVKENS